MSEFIAVLTGDSVAKCASVTNMTFLTPRFAKSKPTSAVLPGPKRIVEVAISKAYSLLSAAVAVKQ